MRSSFIALDTNTINNPTASLGNNLTSNTSPSSRSIHTPVTSIIDINHAKSSTTSTDVNPNTISTSTSNGWYEELEKAKTKTKEIN
jgi:hypothetical protein